MINSLSLFEQTQLAEATYASFGGETGNGDSILQALRGVKKKEDASKDFSQTQAEEFLKHWQVIDQYATGGTNNDPGSAWAGSGFSATLFESLDRPGEYTFAVRGSKRMSDFAASAAKFIRAA